MAKERIVRTIAAVTALIGWAALALQLLLIMRMFGPVDGPWRYFGFFTVLSNIGIALVASAVALGRGNALTGASARLMGLTAIVTVGLVYSVLLRHLWDPKGLQKIADAGLHDVTPLLFALLWGLMPHGALKWRDLGWALAPPAIYLAYALLRGAFDGWYPYYFLDPTTQSLASLLTWLGGVMATFAIVAASAIAIDMRLARGALGTS